MMIKIMSISMAALFTAALSISAQAAENPFGMNDLQSQTQLSMSSTPGGKCGGGDKESKCGGTKKETKGTEGKCGGG